MILTRIFLQIYGANSDKLSNSDKSFLEHGLHFSTSHSLFYVYDFRISQDFTANVSYGIMLRIKTES